MARLSASSEVQQLLLPYLGTFGGFVLQLLQIGSRASPPSVRVAQGKRRLDPLTLSYGRASSLRVKGSICLDTIDIFL